MMIVLEKLVYFNNFDNVCILRFKLIRFVYLVKIDNIVIFF